MLNKNEMIFDRMTKSMGGKFQLKDDHLLSFLLSSTREIGLKIIKSIRISSQIPEVHIDFIRQ